LIELPEIPEPRPSGRAAGALHGLHSLVAILVALAAITLAAWEGFENRRHNRLSVQPRLAASVAISADDGGSEASMSIESTGLGPAVIRRFHVYLDGALLDTADVPLNDPFAPVTRVFAGAVTGINTRTLGIGYFFPAGARTVLLELGAAPGDRQPLADLLSRVAIDICYCSVYDSDCGQTLVATREIDVPSC
jgi:hypothetical protein